MSDFISLSNGFEPQLPILLAMFAVAAAYAVFTLVGFGSALLAGGALAQVMPVAQVIPLLALLDFAGSSLRGWRARQELAWSELRLLLPGMLCGQLLGVFVLARLPAKPMAMVLGLFVAYQGLSGLLAGKGGGLLARSPLFSGLIGGMLGGLFGSGGFIYAACLERRLTSRDGFRATQAVLIALSTAWRIGLCLFMGLLDLPLLTSALLFVPAMLCGIALGHRLDVRLGREQLFRLLNGLLLASGIGLLFRFAG